MGYERGKLREKKEIADWEGGRHKKLLRAKRDGISGEGDKVKMDYVTCPGGAGTNSSLSSGPC